MNTYIGINGNKLRMKADMEEAEFPIWGDDSVSASKQTWEQYLSSLPVIEIVAFEVEIGNEYTDGIHFEKQHQVMMVYNRGKGDEERWVNVAKVNYDDYSETHRRIVALPISKIEERERSVVDGLIAKGFPALEEDGAEVPEKREEWFVGDKFTTPETGETVFTVEGVSKYDVTAHDPRSRAGITVFSKWYITKVTTPSPSPIKSAEACGVCGSAKVFIRGKYPKQDKRLICPTCAYERLEQINEMSSPNRGIVSTASQFRDKPNK